jgi:hypothetical protein
MSLFINEHKNLFEYLKEESEDDATSSSTDPEQDSTTSEEDQSSEDNNSDNDDYGSDDDFNIDASLDDNGSDDNNDSGDDSSSADNSSTDSSSSEDSGDEEPVKANTDIFSSLSGEEQQIKIKELKNLFNDLYTSTDDLLSKINEIDPDQDSLDILTRVTSMMYYTRQYMRDYINNIFKSKSYIENDVAFNRFLTIINSISGIIEDLVKEREEKYGKSEKK